MACIKCGHPRAWHGVLAGRCHQRDAASNRCECFAFAGRGRCPHRNLRGIYGDEIIAVGWWRLQCLDCGQYLYGPVSLAERGDS